MRWTQEQLTAYEERRRAYRKYASNQASDSPSSAKPEQAAGHASARPLPRAQGNSVRRSVRIVSFRVRPIDPDNLCGKYFVDTLRYAGILVDDTASVMDYSIRQEKAETKEQERTIIEIA
jgi:hypothetical protein